MCDMGATGGVIGRNEERNLFYLTEIYKHNCIYKGGNLSRVFD